MKNLLVFITLCLILISCSKAKDDLKIETNGYCSEKKAISIATEALDHITDANYQITYVGVKPDLFIPAWLSKYDEYEMSNVYKDYFVKDQFRDTPKKDARVHIAERKKIPTKHIGYSIDIAGKMYDDVVEKNFSMSIFLDIDMMSYVYYPGSDWDYYRAYNIIPNDSISNYMNSSQVESAKTKKYKDDSRILIGFYD